MKQIKRLAAAAQLVSDNGVLTAHLIDFDGGPFNLTPHLDDDAVILPRTDGTGYGLRIQGDPEVLGRLGKALLSVSRNAKGEDEDGADGS